MGKLLRIIRANFFVPLPVVKPDSALTQPLYSCRSGAHWPNLTPVRQKERINAVENLR